MADSLLAIQYPPDMTDLYTEFINSITYLLADKANQKLIQIIVKWVLNQHFEGIMDDLNIDKLRKILKAIVLSRNSDDKFMDQIVYKFIKDN